MVAGRADREADIGFTTGRATYRPTHTGLMQLHQEKINNTGDFDTAVYFNWHINYVARGSIRNGWTVHRTIYQTIYVEFYDTSFVVKFFDGQSSFENIGKIWNFASTSDWI